MPTIGKTEKHSPFDQPTIQEPQVENVNPSEIQKMIFRVLNEIMQIIPDNFYTVSIETIPPEIIQQLAAHSFREHQRCFKMRSDIAELSARFSFIAASIITFHYTRPYRVGETDIDTKRTDHLRVLIEDNGRVWLFSIHDSAAVIDPQLLRDFLKLQTTDTSATEMLATYLATTQHPLINNEIDQLVNYIQQIANECNFPFNEDEFRQTFRISNGYSPVHCYAAGLPQIPELPDLLADIFAEYFHLTDPDKGFKYIPRILGSNKWGYGKKMKPINFQDLIRQAFLHPLISPFFHDVFPSIGSVIQEWIDLHKQKKELSGYLYPEHELRSLSPKHIALLILVEWLTMNDEMDCRTTEDIIERMLHIEKENPDGNRGNLALFTHLEPTDTKVIKVIKTLVSFLPKERQDEVLQYAFPNE